MTIHHKIGLRYPGIAGVVLALLVVLSGCHKEVGEIDPTGESDGGARHVRIAASIDSYSLPGSRPSTRAAGTVEEVGSGIWDPQAKLGLDYERAVYFAVLYIYPNGKTTPSDAWIYFTNAFAAGCKSLKEDKSSPLSEIKDDLDELSQSNSHVRHFASTELTKGTLTMDLELEPGKYKFVLVANSIPALTSAIESTTNPADPRGLKSEETAFTSLDLMPNTVTKLPRRFMPMVGSQDFTITSSTAVPQVISSPTIDLERTFARLDVCLTTATDDKQIAYHEKDGNVPTDFRFLEYSLKGMGGYEQPLFPLESEKTAIKEKSTAKVAAPTTSEVIDPKITVESKEGPILLSNIAKSFDEKEANTFNTPTKLSTPWAEPIQVSKLWKSPIFRTTTDEAEPAGKYYGSFTKDPESASADAKHPAIHLYIPSLYQERRKDHEVSFTLKFGRATDASLTKTKEYTISLTNQRDATDLYAIRRNTWYRYELKFYGEKMRVLGPLTITPQDWSLEEEELSYDDEYIVLTQDTIDLSAAKGAKGKFMILSDQLGSDPKSLTYTFNGGTEAPDWLKMDKQPTSLTGESTEVAFYTTSENEDDNDMPRVCELVITPKDYKRPLRVVIRQLPIQYIQARPYVAFVGDKASGPLSTQLTVNAHGYDWDAELVDTYCTAASTGNWLTVKKLDDHHTLEISVTPVEERMNILRIGMIKIYDGTNHPAYIRVEQGGYKAIELDNGQVWLDRNMGALSFAHYEQWKGGAVITGFDRVRVNGAFYQTGRVPDGYQYNGMDLLAGNINTNLTAAEKIDLLALRQPRRLGDAAGTGSSSIVSPEEQLPAADPQYHKFIASGARDNWYSEPFRTAKWFSFTPGKKREGLDPCPEGYRIPFQNEFEDMINGTQINSEGGRAGGSKFFENAMGYFYKTKDAGRSLYIPLGGWRDTDGTLKDWLNVDNTTPKARYAIYNTTSPLLASYYLVGYDTAQLGTVTKGKTAEGYLVRCIKITNKE